MSKTAKIVTISAVCLVCVLSIVFGCLFGIKCTITFDYGFELPKTNYGTNTTSSAYGGISSLKFYAPYYAKSADVVRFTKYVPERPSRNGYTFAGWFKDSARMLPWDNSAVSSDMTLYAKWTKDV